MLVRPVGRTRLIVAKLVGRTFLALGYAILCMLGVAAVAAVALFLSTIAETPPGERRGRVDS